MHLCFVAPRAWPVLSGDPAIPIVGGAEVQQCLLARMFAGHGHRVSMICLDYGQPQRARIDGIEVVKICGADDGLPVRSAGVTTVLPFSVKVTSGASRVFVRCISRLRWGNT